MDYEEIKERRKTNIRTGMDIGMGMFYMVIGSVVIYAKSYGHMEVPPAIAYLLGGMMVIGGIFRFIRGIKAILPQKDDSGTGVS